jgi:CheY-like chemotaxis protein
MNGLLLCDDLLFTSRITATARALGLEVTPIRDAESLLQQAITSRPKCVLIDLHNPGLDIDELLSRLAGESKPTVVAFGSHVDTETLKKARAAGCDLVLPRSKFVEDLDKELPRWCGQE